MALRAHLSVGVAFRWNAANSGLQFDQIDEDIGLAKQFVGDHRGIAGDGGNCGNVNAASLHRLDQRTEIAIAREEHYPIDTLGQLHGIDSKLDIHVTLRLAASAGVDELPACLSNNGIPVVVQPIEHGANRGEPRRTPGPR